MDIVKNQYLKLWQYIRAGYDEARKGDQIFMIIMALLVGALSGFGAVGIRALIHGISDISFMGEGSVLTRIQAAPWYVVLMVPAIGGLVVGPMIHFFAREAKGHGVPEVMQAILLKGGFIRKRVAFIKAVASSITIGTGGSVGREGPIVQIGASIGSTVGQFFHIPTKRIKTLVGAGAAAGIAAAFNAPIAGALFAVEIILMDFAFAQFSPIVIASVMATVISHHFEGNFAAFQVPLYQTSTPFELILYGILGLLSGLFSFIFIRVLYFSEEYVERIHFPEYLKPALGGLAIGAIALAFPHVMGVGYDSINDALHGRLIGGFAFLLIFIKIIATAVTLGSGGSGGIFAPSLFMGAMLGAFFGHGANLLLPGLSLNPGAYALVAMGGMVAGTTRGSITAIIMVFELTNDYRIILPLMITCIISTILSSKLSSESIYTLKLLRRNINVKAGTDQNVLRSIYIQDVVSKSFATIAHNSNFKEVVNKLIKATIPYYFVVDDNKKLVGILSLQQIKNLLFERDTLNHILIASELATREFPIIYPTDNAQAALEKMSKTTYECLPVMDPKREGRMLGVVWRKDINDAYNKEIERLEISSNLASKISMNATNKEVHFLEGYAVAEVPAPKEFQGKSIREINIRKNYSVDVLSIRTQHKNRSKVKAIPDPDHIITEEDYLIMAGELAKLNRIRNME